MNVFDNINQFIESKPLENDSIAGKLQTIQVCFDPIAGEFLNVGVFFKVQQSGQFGYKLLDSLSRFDCMYGDRMSPLAVQELIEDIEYTINSSCGDIHDGTFGPYIKLCTPRYASGKTINEIVNRSYLSSVPLGRERESLKRRDFHFKTTPSLRREFIECIETSMDVFAAQKIITNEPIIRVSNGRKTSIDVPLYSGEKVGSVVSAWYANPVKVKGEMLSALFELKMASEILHTDRSQISILRPNENCGMKKTDFRKVDKEVSIQIEKFRNFNIDVIESSDISQLAQKTIGWWSNAA